MAILKSLPTSAKINGESVQGSLLKIKSSVIRVDKILKKDFQKEKRDVELTRRRAEKIFRKKLENRVEQKDKLDKVAPKKISVPGLSFLDSFKSFVSKVVLGFFAIKLLPLLPKLIPVAIGLGKFVNFFINLGGRLLDGIITFVDFGFRAGEATNGFIKQIGGEKTAEIFSKFGGAITGLIDAALLIGLLSLNESGQDFMFDQKNRKPKGPKGGGPLKGAKRSLKRTSLKSFGKTGTKNLAKFGKGLKNFGPLKIIFTVLDFTGRRSQGQSILQSVLGSGGGLAGFSAGAKAGAALGTLVAPGVGSLIGGFIGGMIGASLGAGIADKITGANKIQGRNEGGLVKRKEQDRFKSKDQSMRDGKLISPIKFDADAKEIFPNDIGNLPASGKYIEDSFKDVRRTPAIGGLMGLTYKMITGQKMSQSEFEVASNNLKAAAKFGFSSRMLKKSFEDASRKVAGDRNTAISMMKEGGTAKKEFPAILQFMRKNIAPIFGISSTFDPNGKRTTVFEAELKLLRQVSMGLLTVAAAIALIISALAVFAAFSPAVAITLTKIATFANKIFRLKGVPKGVAAIRRIKFKKPTVTAKGVGKFAKPESLVRTRVQVENAMDPLRVRKPGEDVVLDILRRSGDITTNTTTPPVLSRAEQVKARFDRLINLRKAKSDLVGTGRRGTQNIRKGRIGKDFRIEKPDGKSLTESLIESIDVIKKPLDQGGVTSPRQLSLSRKILDPKRFSREAAKAAKQQKLVRDNVNKSLRESNVGDDFLRSVEADPKLAGARSVVERETGSIIREFLDRGITAKTINEKIQFFDFKGKQITDPDTLNKIQKLINQSPLKFAKGGLVKGAGGIDNIPAMLSPNEFVLDFDTTSALRSNYPGFLSALNKASDKEDIINILQNYASYESGIGGGSKVIYIDAPVTKEINIASDTSSGVAAPSSKPRSNPFRRLARVG